MQKISFDIKNNLGITIDWLTEYYHYLTNDKHISPTWFREYQRVIYRLDQYIVKKGIKDINTVTAQILLDFQDHLYNTYYIKKTTMRCKVVVIRELFTYLYHKKLIQINPAVKLKILPQPNEKVEKTRRYYNWEELLSRWFRQMKMTGYSWRGIKQKQFTLEQFIQYLKTNNIKTIYKTTLETIKQYEAYLRTIITGAGTNYREFCILNKLRQIHQFFTFINYTGIISDEKIPTKQVDFSKLYHLMQEQKQQTKQEKLNLQGLTGATKLELMAEKFISWRMSQGFRDDTRSELRRFLVYLITKGIPDLALVTKKDILDYQMEIGRHRTRKGKPYSQNSIHNYMRPVFSIFKFLYGYEFIPKDPTQGLKPPKQEDGLPRTLMTTKEVQKLLNAPDIMRPIGIRDRTMMEVLYSTGMRAGELQYIVPGDINFEDGTVKINHPKGGPSFQRVVPIGITALDWIKRYISESRPQIDKYNLQYLFLTKGGNQMDAETLTQIIKDYCYRLGIKKNITSHSFRVTCATLMLKNKADIRYVQEQLGHRSITSTQIYTRLIPEELKLIHEKCHPREREARGLEPTIKIQITKFKIQTETKTNPNTKTIELHDKTVIQSASSQTEKPTESIQEKTP